MKKYLMVLCLFLSANALMSQVRSVWTDIFGNVEMVVEVGNRCFVVIDTRGNIVDMMLPDNYVEYYSGFYAYEAGKIKNMGGVEFTYYSDFYSYESGKVKSVGGIPFTYYSDFYDYEVGKIKSIGNSKFTYYSNFYDYESGKIKSISGVDFTYYSGFYDHEKGKLKSIGNNQYTYFSRFDGSTGQFKSGNTRFVINNIEFNLIFRTPRPRQSGCCPLR